MSVAETVEHFLVSCPKWDEPRGQLLQGWTGDELDELTSTIPDEDVVERGKTALLLGGEVCGRSMSHWPFKWRDEPDILNVSSDDRPTLEESSHSVCLRVAVFLTTVIPERSAIIRALRDPPDGDRAESLADVSISSQSQSSNG